MRQVRFWSGRKFVFQNEVRRHAVFAAMHYWPGRLRKAKFNEAVQAMRDRRRHCLDIDA